MVLLTTLFWMCNDWSSIHKVVRGTAVMLYHGPYKFISVMNTLTSLFSLHTTLIFLLASCCLVTVITDVNILCQILTTLSEQINQISLLVKVQWSDSTKDFELSLNKALILSCQLIFVFKCVMLCLFEQSVKYFYAVRRKK